MLKVYECYPVVNINGEWEDLAISTKTRVFETVPMEDIHFKTFEELYEADVPYFNSRLTFFKEKVCYISLAFVDFPKRITKKNFPKDGIRYGWKHDEIKNPTMEYLFKNLPADDLIKYLKEREISFENLLTNR